MACEQWRGKLDAYADGELDPAEDAALGAHLRECAACAARVLENVQLKRSLQSAGKRFTPGSELRDRIAKIAATNSPPKPAQTKAWSWTILAFPALSVIILSVAVNLYVRQQSERRQQLFNELADQHVAALASASPVDVVSTDRHTVKPWFQGKIPFSFNLPELQGTEFTLLGARVTYLGQTPGAHLIYQIRKHEISVFVFPERAGPGSVSSRPIHALSFNMESWTHNGLSYFVVADVNASEIQALSRLFRDAD